MKRLDLVYQKLKELHSGKGATALEIAEALNLNRANVSNDLNKLCQEGRAAKGQGRPVQFIPCEEVTTKNYETTLDKFGNKNQSLYTAVEQAKAAILYPPKGMHILILGDTGVGKSMFAGLIHRYAIEMKVMQDNAPLVTFNCADYANNPQLLISQLFGTKKGAYTGADSDRTGLIEKADGGILFLDEVHRLPPEGQEMFFTFMDKGTFRRLGETESERRAKVLIISATTENPDSTLLKTFTRRIPMVIRIPGLSERTIEERFQLISLFLKEESSRLSKEIMVSVNSMRALLSYDCENNVGQLKTDVQLICAKAYADFVSNKKNVIKINSTDLPHYIREGLYRETEHRQIWNKLVGINQRYCVFSKGEENVIFEGNPEEASIYDMIDARINQLRDRGLEGGPLEEEIKRGIKEYFRKYMSSVNKRFDISNLENVIDSDVVKVVEEILHYSEERLNRVLSEKVYYGMAVHIASSIERIKRNKKIVNPELNKIRTEYSEEFNTAVDCLKIIEREFDITLPIDEAGFLAMFLVFDDRDILDQKDDVKIIIVAHGNYTATSMAEVANKLLGVEYAVGINAPLDERPQQVLLKIKDYIVNTGIKSDILFLVDMGSLTTFGEEVEKELNIKTKTIPLVSTLHVIEASRKAMMGYSLEEVFKETLNVNYLLDNGVIREHKDEDRRKKLAIVTVCTTGEGSAIAVKNFLEGHLEYDSSILEIIPINLVDKENIHTKLKNISREKGIVCVVSSFNLAVKIPKFGLEEVLSLRAIKAIQNAIDVETTYLKMGETLKYQLKNIDGAEVFADIKKFIQQVEDALNTKIDTNILIGVTLHMGCMIDRLKAGDNIIEFEEREKYIEENEELYEVIKKACEPINKKYKMEILRDEICFIMSFFNSKNYL